MNIRTLHEKYGTMYITRRHQHQDEIWSSLQGICYEEAGEDPIEQATSVAGEDPAVYARLSHEDIVKRIRPVQASMTRLS